MMLNEVVQGDQLLCISHYRSNRPVGNSPPLLNRLFFPRKGNVYTVENISYSGYVIIGVEIKEFPEFIWTPERFLLLPYNKLSDLEKLLWSL